MKGRSLRGTWAVTSIVIGLIGGLVAGCGGGGNDDTAAILPAESIDQALLTATDQTDPIVISTLPPTTTAAPASTTTAPAETTVAPTAAPTIVETLPVPAPPPEPRADEPYTELGTLEIPKLGVSQTLLEGITLNTLDKGPGHWPGTAMPGHLGNVVIAGHRTSHGKVFRNVDQLAAGDQVILTTGEGRFVYVVSDVVVVQPDALYIIEQTPASTATLFACHPPGSTRQRIVVHLALQA
ncbi:MAG: peptidase family protein [Ilumatobacteraceae bacterium]|nr:peptidase family protein [Ilumatobacteraceae bacterium]